VCSVWVPFPRCPRVKRSMNCLPSSNDCLRPS
jgi:hypothetical protein